MLSRIALVLFLLAPHFAWAGEAVVPKSNQAPVKITDDDGNPVFPGDATNKAIRVNLVAGTITGADGALLDGVSSSIKATVKDYANSNPLTVVVVDTNGDAASIGGGTQYNQGTVGGAADTLTMAGCVRTDTAAVDAGVADGDRVRCIVDATGKMWVNVGTVPVTGTFWQGTQPVSLASVPSHAVTNAGTFEVQSTNAAETTKVLGTVRVLGNVGGVMDTTPGSTAAANVINNGAKGVNAEQAAVTNGQQANLISDLVGKQIVLPYANPENFVMGTTAAITDTTSTSLIASAGGSLRNYITSVLVTNSHATVGTFVKILDGSTIIWEGFAAAVGGGFASSFPVPIKGTAATAINCQPVTTGANVICSAAGYKGL